MMLVKLYGLFAYTIGLSSLVVFMLFLGQWQLLPININTVPELDFGTALVVNFALTLIFAVQHSVMARGSVKACLTKYLPASIERSNYVLFSGICLYLICFYWQGSPEVLWQVEHTIAAQTLTIVQWLGWLILVLATFEIDHFELMGLKQVFVKNYNAYDAEHNKKLVEKYLYKWVRHPIQLGVFIGIWSTPYMSSAHFMMATLLTLYMFIGLYFEEKALVKHFGEQYLAYKKRVPMLLPIKFS